MSVKAGYATQLFIGTVGSTAATQVTKATDVDYNLDPERGDTTPRGDGSAVPVITSMVTGLKPTITFKIANRPSDTTLSSLITAAKTGAPIAMRTKSHSSGLGYDGDVNVGFKQAAPVNGVGMFDFTCEADETGGRTPQTWV